MARRGLPHRHSGRRLSFLTGAAALGAVGVALVYPTGPTRALASDTTSDAAQLQPGDAMDAGEGLAQAASAIPQAQARAHTIAEITAQRTAAAEAAAAAAERASAGPDEFRAYAKDKVGATQFSCLDKLWTRESHWRNTAQNPSSTAYGIAQLLDSTWAYTGVAKTSDGFGQVDAGLAYIDAAYGSPCSAWSHETNAGWY
jgi:hypothetical protein